jgi:flavin-dependent dehydrogenase
MSATSPHRRLPVILGSGLTGMSISTTLSRAGVDHVLVGGPPGTLPRLGESLNLEGTLLLREMYPELSRYFFPKRIVAGYLAGYRLTCDFDVAERLVSRVMFRALGYRAVGEFLQFDRLGFDAALWEQTAASPRCTVVDAKVAGLRYDAAGDAFSGVELADGTTLSPSYLFDASNHGRVLGKAAELKMDTLGEPQRVAYTHFHAPEGVPVGVDDWERATVIVRLFRDSDSIDAIAWCIPLGRYVSIGISLSADESDASDEELLELTERAFARYGVRYRERFSVTVPLMGLKHQYFVYERAAGTNWLLAGPSFAQVWWMAGAGVGTALAAAQLAPRLLHDPVRWGGEYDRYMRKLVPIHGTFDYFAVTPREGYVPRELHRYSDRFTVTNLLRLAAATRLRGRGRVVAPAVHWLFSRPGVIRDFCEVDRVAVETAPAPAPVPALAGVGGDREALVRRLMAVIGGRAPLEDAARTDTWAAWVGFIRSRGVDELEPVVDRVVENPDGTLTAMGRFRGTRGGRPVEGGDGAATYRVEDGRIVEIWTGRRNYDLIFGWRTRHPFSWLLVLAQMALWSRLTSPRPRLPVAALEPEGGA